MNGAPHLGVARALRHCLRVQIYSYADHLLRSPGWDWDVFSRDEDPQRFLVELLRLGGDVSDGAAADGGQPAATQQRPHRQPRAVGFKLFPGEAAARSVA